MRIIINSLKTNLTALQMKYAVLAGLLLAQSAAKENNTEEEKQYIKLAEGLLDGTIDINIDAKCIEDVKTLAEDAVKLEQDIKGHHYLKLYGDVKELMKEAKLAETDCGVKSKFGELADAMIEPTSFEWSQKGSIAVNNVEIYEDLQSAVSSWENKDLYAFG